MRRVWEPLDHTQTDAASLLTSAEIVTAHASQEVTETTLISAAPSQAPQSHRSLTTSMTSGHQAQPMPHSLPFSTPWAQYVVIKPVCSRFFRSILLKEFDTVRRATLISKMAQLQSPDNIFNWIIWLLWRTSSLYSICRPLLVCRRSESQRNTRLRTRSCVIYCHCSWSVSCDGGEPHF